MKERNWSYLAGIFDGEGCISPHTYCVNKERGYWAHQVAIRLTSTDERLMKWIIKTFGGVYYARGLKTAGNKTAYYWMPKGKQNRINFLLGVLPYLIIKREQALLGLEYERLTGICPDKRIEIQNKIRALNSGKGRTVTTNTSDALQDAKTESDLQGDLESAPLVTADA